VAAKIWYLKNVQFLLGHPVDMLILKGVRLLGGVKRGSGRKTCFFKFFMSISRKRHEIRP